MRKEHKQNIEKYIELLPQICEAIRTSLTSNHAEAERLLEEFRQGMALVKGLILEEEGMNCPTLDLLEQYEAALPEGDAVVWDALKRSMAQDIKAKKEVVFLPYKASMWDSLESVWKAADEDPECDAYVIPIPYYDKNPDGSFKEMHYEGDLYPDYVPVTNWQEYDLQKHHPDVVFIHNPYDDGNHVTSVHPFFYSKNLKQFTDKLVYIPYFVAPNILTKTLCVTSGSMNADLVVVQSEEIRQNYIDCFQQVLKEEDPKKL
jgi:hypothetical protein